MENPYQRVEDDDPRRCQAVISVGQCTLISQPEKQYCILHCGPSHTKAAKEKDLKNYRLSKWQARCGEKANSNHLKSISDEIGILRMILEERINVCKDEYDLIAAAPIISDLVVKINILIQSLHKMETALGQMLHQNQVAQIIDSVVDIINKHVENAETMEAIADELATIFDRRSDSIPGE